MNYEQEIEYFKKLTMQMAETFARKRNDYGNSTEDTLHRYGRVSLLVRMRDKLNRLDNLLLNKDNSRRVMDENINDTLLDLANYAIIAILELTKDEMELKRNELNGKGCRMD